MLATSHWCDSCQINGSLPDYTTANWMSQDSQDTIRLFIKTNFSPLTELSKILILSDHSNKLLQDASAIHPILAFIPISRVFISTMSTDCLRVNLVSESLPRNLPPPCHKRTHSRIVTPRNPGTSMMSRRHIGAQRNANPLKSWWICSKNPAAYSKGLGRRQQKGAE